VGEINGVLKHLHELLSDNATQKQRIDSLQTLVKIRIDRLSKNMQQRDLMNKSYPTFVQNMVESRKGMLKCRMLIDIVIQNEKALLQTRIKDKENSSRRFLNTFLIIFSLFFAVQTITFLLISRQWLTITRFKKDTEKLNLQLKESNDELKTYNEELHSLNEELNTLNEELNQSNHEYQALNEELNTTNLQLKEAYELIEQQSEIIRVQSEEKLKQILDSLNDVVWSFEFTPKKNVFINKGIEKITENPSYEIQPSYQILLDITHPEDVHLKIKSNEDLLENGYAECTYRIIDSLQDTKWLYDKMYLRRDESGNPTRVDGITQDISSFKKAEAEKNKLIRQLNQQIEDLRHFSYVISHNFRAPIARILGLVSIIDMESITNKTLKEIIEQIDYSTKQVDEIIFDLNKVLEIRDLMNVTYEDVNFQEAFEQAKEMLRKEIESSQVVFSVNFEVSSIYSFKSYIHSIMFNLLSNAIKYQSPQRILKIDILTQRKGNKTMLIIKDNGMGIDLDKYKSKLFQIYQRFHLHVKGKGIGLYLVKSQVESLGGKIEVNSEPEVGTTFTIQLKDHLFSQEKN
jgi:signal transduction histidine kinase